MRWIACLVVLPAVLLLAAACEDQQEQIESQSEAAEQRVGTVPIFEMRTDDCFIEGGRKDECSRVAGIDTAGVLQKIAARWPGLIEN